MTQATASPIEAPVTRPERPAILRLRGVVKSFEAFTAVDGIDLDVHEGEFLTIVGPSGSGKTTLLRMLAGMEQPTSGEISLRGQVINDVPANRRPTCLVFQSLAGGAEAVDVAIKCARFATQRRKVISIHKGYHGHSGLSVATGDERFSRIFLSDQPELFTAVPFNDLEAMESTLQAEDVAAVIVETIPATYGFPLPQESYHQVVRARCDRYGTMLIADEVQTGLMRTGVMWGFESYGFQPDIFVTAKGISGGLYPISATLLNARAGAWLNIDGAAHISTTGGSELGCCVAWKVIDMLQQPKLAKNVAKVSRFFADGMTQVMKRHADFLVGVRQRGVIMGLEFAGPEDAVHVSRALYENGIWAIFSSLDKRVLQFKPGLLLKRKLCEEILERFDAAMPRAKELSAAAAASRRRAPGGAPARKRTRKAA
jgi:putrescine aminotransferase